MLVTGPKRGEVRKICNRAGYSSLKIWVSSCTLKLYPVTVYLFSLRPPILPPVRAGRPCLAFYCWLMPMVTLGHVVQTLEQDGQHERIKKLLIYACYDTWEDDPIVLQSITMRELVQTALSQSPTFIELELLLEELVDSVTKPVIYAKVGDRILEALEPLYGESEEEDASQTGEAPAAQQAAPAKSKARLSQKHSGEKAETAWMAAKASTPNNSTNSIYQRTLYVLDHSANRERLKKLLLCACQNTWESDPDRLAACSWVELLDQASLQFPHLGAIEATLREIVQALTKPEAYEPIAQELLQILTSFYEEQPRRVEQPYRDPMAFDPEERTIAFGRKSIQPNSQGSAPKSPAALAFDPGESTVAFGRKSSQPAPKSSADPPQSSSGDTNGFSAGFQTITHLVPERTWRKILRKRYIFLGVGGLILVVTTHDFLKHYNPFRQYDICFTKTLAPNQPNYVVYTPVRCSSPDVILRMGVGANQGGLSFRDVDKDGQVDYVVSPEPLGCRFGLQSCPQGEMTAISVELGYNPVFRVIEQR